MKNLNKKLCCECKMKIGLIVIFFFIFNIYAQNNTLFNVKQHGAIGNGIDDDYNYITNIISKANQSFNSIFFPVGVYAISKPIYLQRDGMSLSGVGTNSVLKYIGNEKTDAIVFIGSGNFNITMKDLTIVGNSNCNNAMIVDYSHHSVFERIRLRDAKNGLLCKFNVCNTFNDLTISINEAPWNYQPSIGIILSNSVNSCLFNNVIVEGIDGPGIIITNFCSQNYFNSGTSEGNQSGVIISENCPRNIFVNFDCESNDDFDYNISSVLTTLINCLGERELIINAPHTRIISGAYNNIIITTNSQHSMLMGSAWNIFGNGKYIDKGFSTTKLGLVNLYTGQSSTVIWPDITTSFTPFEIIGQNKNTNYTFKLSDVSVGPGDVIWNMMTKIPSTGFVTNLTLRSFPNYVSTPGYFDSTNGYSVRGKKGKTITKYIRNYFGEMEEVTITGGIITDWNKVDNRIKND